jgi:vitamin B12 transporter
VNSFFLRAGKLFPAGFLILCALCPLPAQQGGGQGEDFRDGEIPLWEDEGITVTGTQETTQQIEVLTREEIEKHHAADLAALLQEALDMGLTRYGAYGNDTSVNLRGFDSERIAFLVDGVPVNSPLAGEFDINRIDPASIERIEVIRGGSDTKYNVSGALGGVINIITLKKQEPGLHLGGSVSNTAAMPGYYRKRDGTTGNPHWEDLADTQNVSAFAAYGAEGHSLSANFFANRAQNPYLYKDFIDKTRRKDNNEIWDLGGRLSFIPELPGYAKLILSADAYYGDKNIPTSGSSSLAGRQQDSSGAQNIMLDMQRAFHDTLAAEASLTHNWHDRAYDPPAGASSRHKEQLLTAINRWSWYPLSGLVLRAGGDYRLSHLDSTDMGLRYRHDGGLYLTAEYRARDNFLVIPSMKGIFSGPAAASPAVPVPKLGFLWTPLESLSIKNNYFRSFKHPDFEDLYWGNDGMTRGNPDLKPEDGWGGDLGVAYQYKNYFSAGSAVFGQWTSDSIHWASGRGGVWRPENVGEAAFFGSENRVKIHIPLSGIFISEIALSFSYQYLLGYLLSYGYTWASDRRIPYMPMHTIGASLDLSWTAGKRELAGSFTVSGHYETERYADTANLSKLDPCFLLDLGINQELNKNLSAFLALHNILNTFRESFADYPMPGITATLGLRLRVEIPRGAAEAAVHE